MIKIVNVQIQADYRRTESVGALGMFQIGRLEGITEEDIEIDLIEYIDQGQFYENGDKNTVMKDLTSKCKKYDFLHCDVQFV